VQVSALADLHGQGRMTWTEPERGWVAVPDEVVAALARGGFEECKLEMTTSRRDLRPAGGVWQGVNRLTGSVASGIWVARATQRDALVFIDIDGERLEMCCGALRWSEDVSSKDVSYRDEGGEARGVSSRGVVAHARAHFLARPPPAPPRACDPFTGKSDAPDAALRARPWRAQRCSR
jgi:hypothetical protein